MYSRRLPQLAVAGAVLAAGIAFAAPASAAVTYDPLTRTGFVGSADVQKAFGWSDEALASRASAVVFDHDFWTDDTYSVACGNQVFPVVHHREFGRYELTDAVVLDRQRGSRTGYAGKPVGFRLAGAHAGISGTSVPPAVGQPCPGGEARGSAIDRVHLDSSASGWSLTLRFDDASHEILIGVQPVR
jgi:hypothetical protein